MSEMEFWRWPPAYDDSYRPPDDQPFWFPVRETMSEEAREAAIVTRIAEVMRYAWTSSPFYRSKWSQAGIHPDQIRTLEDFERVPVLTKEEIRLSQAEHPPFGDYLCIAPADVHRVHGTSGTTGQPTAFGIGRSDWVAIANAHARVMWAMGIRSTDTVIIGSFFSLYMGSWGALIGAERLGATVFPFGAGVPGQTLRAAQWIQHMRPSVFYGTPSYALHLAEVAAENGIDMRAVGLRKLFFSGEPGASIPTIRGRTEELYEAEVFDCGSMAEMSPWMNLAETSSHAGMLAWQDIVYTEVVDPHSHVRVSYGREGTPVYTHLERVSQPMIRLVSGDLTRWEAGPSPCGRTYPIFPRGIYGRIDDMILVRGANVYPSAIDEVVVGIDGYGGEHRIIVSRQEAMDELAVQIEYDARVAAQGEEGVSRLKRQAATALQAAIGVGAKVVPVPPGTLERTEFKARRVIDSREALLAALKSAREG